MKSYLLVMSSFYKALYCRDKLNEKGIKSEIGKVPVELVKSCSQGVFLEYDNLDAIMDVMEKASILPGRIYEVTEEGYVRVL